MLQLECLLTTINTLDNLREMFCFCLFCLASDCACAHKHSHMGDCDCERALAPPTLFLNYYRADRVCISFFVCASRIRRIVSAVKEIERMSWSDHQRQQQQREENQAWIHASSSLLLLLLLPLFADLFCISFLILSRCCFSIQYMWFCPSDTLFLILLVAVGLLFSLFRVLFVSARA